MSKIIKVIGNEFYFKASEVRSLTGLTDGQLWAARERGDLNPLQQVEGGDCYYQIDGILRAHRQVLGYRKLGSAKLRKVPTIKNFTVYHNILKALRRRGRVVDDIADLELKESRVANAGKGGWMVVYKPGLRGQDSSQSSFQSQARRPQDKLEGSGERCSSPQEARLRADHLPIYFNLGRASAKPVLSDPLSTIPGEFKLVRSCYGYYDQTNSECKSQCIFASNCAAACVDILKAIAAKGDVDRAQQQALQEFESRFY